MKLDYNTLEVFKHTRSPYEIWCFENVGTLGFQLHQFRKGFLKRKNVNGYKKTNKNTPIIIDKLINSFDRKIKNISIFTDNVKDEYFERIKHIFDEHYNDTFEPKKSKKTCYFEYLADNYMLYKKNYKSKTFKEFKSSGLLKNYKI
jgi:hypothetical protein